MKIIKPEPFYPSVLALGAAVTLSLFGNPLWADSDQRPERAETPRVLPPHSHPYGKTYGQWSEAWFQWCFSLPVTRHPIFDTAPVGTGQNGRVWFLGGNFTGTPVSRNVTIPPGTALFFPILNFWADNTDCANGEMISDNNPESFLRALVANNMNQAANLSCTIDGIPVRGLSDPLTAAFRAPSPTPGGFSYRLPGTDNLLNFLGLACWSNNDGTIIPVDAAIYHPVADGFYIMVAPLPEGEHTIHAHGALGAFVEDFTYNITVHR
jgi:hypothetical protein